MEASPHLSSGGKFINSSPPTGPRRTSRAPEPRPIRLLQLHPPGGHFAQRHVPHPSVQGSHNNYMHIGCSDSKKFGNIHSGRATRPTCTTSTEVTWLRSYGHLLSSNIQDSRLWIRRYADNRAILVEGNDYHRNDMVQSLASLNFYRKPVQLADEGTNEFLGFIVNANTTEVALPQHSIRGKPPTTTQWLLSVASTSSRSTPFRKQSRNSNFGISGSCTRTWAFQRTACASEATKSPACRAVKVFIPCLIPNLAVSCLAVSVTSLFLVFFLFLFWFCVSS